MRKIYLVQVDTGTEEDFKKYVIAAYYNKQLAEKHVDIINTLVDYFGVNDDPMFGFDYLEEICDGKDPNGVNSKFENMIEKASAKLGIPSIARSGGVFASTKELEILYGIPEELTDELNSTEVKHGTN